MKSSAFFILIFISSFFSYALEIKTVGSKRKLIISKNISNQLNRKFKAYRLANSSDFVPFVNDLYDESFSSKEAPFATFGDFNLDGKKDALIMMVDQAKAKFIFVSILSDETSYKVEKAGSDYYDEENGNFLYLTTLSETEMHYKKVTLGRSLSPRPGVRLNVWGVGPSGGFFCYNNKKMTDCEPYLKK